MSENKINMKNSNSEFQNFMECDFTKHWSFSNFNRQLMTASIINDFYKEHYNLPTVHELGAGDSTIRELCVNNFKLPYIRDIGWKKFDANKDEVNCITLDITSREYEKIIMQDRPDIVILEEVIEHLTREDAYKVIKTIYENVKENSLLILTTPTPPCYGVYEDRVWPTDHAEEFAHIEIEGMLNRYFKIEKSIGWSMEKREMNELLEKDDFARKIYCRLKDAFPESYIRALLPSLVNKEYNRQMLYACRRRREEAFK